MILIPSQSDKECVPSNQVWGNWHCIFVNTRIYFLFSQLSSIGFVGLVLSLINAAMSLVNNANSNNNNRNNNNNDNNDNNNNINIANLNSDTMNMQTAMAGRSLWSQMRRLLRCG